MAVSPARLSRLIEEVLNGTCRRTCFQPWEVELLLDIECTALGQPRRRDLLRRYRKAALRHLERDAAAPLKLSEYLERLQIKRQAREGDTPEE